MEGAVTKVDCGLPFGLSNGWTDRFDLFSEFFAETEMTGIAGPVSECLGEGSKEGLGFIIGKWLPVVVRVKVKLSIDTGNS
jgi:hypothetical protein